MTNEDESKIATFLKDHPRMLGVLFTLTLAVAQAGTVVAEGSGTGGYSGP